MAIFIYNNTMRMMLTQMYMYVQYKHYIDTILLTLRCKRGERCEQIINTFLTLYCQNPDIGDIAMNAL